MTRALFEGICLFSSIAPWFFFEWIVKGVQ